MSVPESTHTPDAGDHNPTAGRDASSEDRARLNREGLYRALRQVEQVDGATAAHTWRVVLYARALFEAAGYDRETVDRVAEGAALHDLGKLDVPIEILQKPGKLTDQEYQYMKEHTIYGHARLLADGVNDQLVLDIVRSHHERLDGSGYPDGLAGDEIPRAAQLFAVIDTFDAMTSLRPYRTAVGAEAAEASLRELHDKAGMWYLPEAVERFEELYRKGQLDWILEYFNTEEYLLRPIPALGHDHSTAGMAPHTKQEGIAPKHAAGSQ